jgi:hypothetical protein
MERLHGLEHDQCSICLGDDSLSGAPRKSGYGNNAHQRWTDSDDDELIELRDQGLPAKEIASRIGRTPAAVNARSSYLLSVYARCGVCEKGRIRTVDSVCNKCGAKHRWVRVGWIPVDSA